MNDCMSHDQANAILHALANYEIVDFDEHFQLLRRSKRARELSVVRASLAILKDAREATLRDFGDYGDVHTALTIFEKSARLHGCRDVRVLALASDGSLRPWPYVGLGSTWSTEPMTAYVAGEYLGYWCDLAMTSDVSCPSTLLAKEALGVVTSDLHAGTTARSLHEALERQLGTEASNVTLRVTGIGLGLEEAPFLDDQTAITLEGDLLSVRTWARVGQVLSSAIEHVVVGGAGCTKLSLS
jgi:Xaa-Pro aminopeptidase